MNPKRFTSRRTKEPTRPTKPDNFTGTLRIAFFISLSGLMDASYLTYLSTSVTKTCVAGTGCTSVLASAYASVAGIPVAALGMGMYLAMAWMTGQILKKQATITESLPLLLLLSTAGVSASVYFTAVQAFILGQWCPFCLLSAILAAVYWGICVYLSIKSGLFKPPFQSQPVMGREFSAVILVLALPPCLVVAVGMSDRSAGLEKSLSKERIVGTIGGRSYTLGQVDEAIRRNLQHLEEERYAERKKFLETELLGHEAKSRGLTTKALLHEEVMEKIAIDREEIREFIVQNRSRLPKQLTPEFIKKIERSLKNEKIPSVRITYIERLKEKHGIRFSLPLPDRLTIDLPPGGDYPESGPVNAPVTIVEYSDFECPYCSKTHKTLKEVTRRYPEKIRLIFRHFPLRQHPNAKKAAEMAYCAQKQGRFWDFADIVFKNQKELSGNNLYLHAEQAGVDMDDFRECLNSGIAKKAVDRDTNDGKRWGLESTPSLFINGRYFSGLPDNIDEIIKEELAAQERGSKKE